MARRRNRTAALLAVALGLTACAPFPAVDHGPRGAVDVSRVPDAVPRLQPRSRYGNPPAYTVDGRTYRVLPRCRGYHQRGIASWYGSQFHGGRTSSGEPYDMYAMTAASKVLPLPCYVRVTNLQNGKSVVVKVNDRGPFVENRLIDLSYAAASRLDMLGTGTAVVDVRAVGPGETAAAAGSKRPVTAGPAPGAATEIIRTPQIFIQVGAYASRGNAEAVLRRLQASRIAPAFLLPERDSGRTLYKVRVGPLDAVEQVDALTNRLDALGLRDSQVVIP